MADTVTLVFSIGMIALTFWLQHDSTPAYKVVEDEMTTLMNEQIKEHKKMISSARDELKLLKILAHEAAQKKKQEQEEKEEKEELSKGESGTGVIGFSAYTNTSGLQNYVLKYVVYESVESNIGGHYNASSGVFTCPVTGLYYFTINSECHTDPGMHAFVYLVMDEKDAFGSTIIRMRDYMQLVRMAEENGETYDFHKLVYGRSTNSGLVWCEKGSPVGVKSMEMGVLTGGKSAFRLSTFSGFLVY